MKIDNKGFTLIELIIVIVILGILAAVAVPIYTNAIEQRKGEVCINNMRVIFSAWRAYNLKNEPNYAPVGWVFLDVNQINSQFGTSIDEKNFGWGNVPGFWFITGGAGNDVYLWMWGYRINDSSKYLQCRYYYKRTTGTIYDWSGSNWPWIPPNE